MGLCRSHREQSRSGMHWQITKCMLMNISRLAAEVSFDVFWPEMGRTWGEHGAKNGTKRTCSCGGRAGGGDDLQKTTRQGKVKQYHQSQATADLLVNVTMESVAASVSAPAPVLAPGWAVAWAGGGCLASRRAA